MQRGTVVTADQESEDEDEEDIDFEDEDFEGDVVFRFGLTHHHPLNKQWFLKDHFGLFATDDEEDMLEHYLAEKSDSSTPASRTWT